MAEGAPDDDTLELTPTWILAIVCAVMVVISMAAERGLHYLGKVTPFLSARFYYLEPLIFSGTYIVRVHPIHSSHMHACVHAVPARM